MPGCDLVLRGGLVLDGSGRAAARADMAIDGDTIIHIGDGTGWRGARDIALHGRVLAPGFIDVHTHDDWAAITTPGMACKITQGVTTVICGNCGVSAAPSIPQPGLPAPFTITPDVLRMGFADVAAYAGAVGQAGPAVNVSLLAGHSTLRAGVMGCDLKRPATAPEIAQMAEMLDRALSQGAIGLSSGLDYPAALAAPAEELVALARVLKAHERAVYTTHMRDESDGVIAAVEEALDTARQAGARLVISHHKCAGRANFGKSVRTLALIDAARQTQPVAMDVYPYTASSSALIRRFVPAAEDVLITWSDPHPGMAGRLLDDIARDWGCAREDAADRLHPAGAIYFDMDEGDLQRIMAHPATMIGSDGLPGAGRPHPRLWGTFPRVLGRYVRELRLLTLARAVHKMTGLPARTFGLQDRGLLRPGYKADLVVFDPDRIADRADYDHPERPGAGVNYVLVNGAIAVEQGRQTAARAGRFLER